MQIPEDYKRELANRFISRDECAARLNHATKEADAQGLMNDQKVVAQLSHFHERYKRSEQDLKMFLCYIAANPQWYPECVMWMIDIQGMMEGNVEKFKDPAVAEMATSDPESFKETVLNVGGSQMQEIHQYLITNKFRVTDKQLCSDNRWVLGCQCTDEEAKQLCAIIYHHYEDEIEMGVISIRRMPWNLGIIGMTSVAEAREWLRANPET